MAILELLARAETSSDLEHHDYDCHVDVIGAAGLAALHQPDHFALYRLKYLNDTHSLSIAKAVFIRWTYRSMQNRKLEPQGASRVGVQALTAWIQDTCNVCKGRKHRVIEGTPALSDKVCPSCNGTGKNQIKTSNEIAEVMRDVAERADSAILALQSGINFKLGRE